MKKYLNRLYVTSQGSYLNKEGETVVVSVEQEKKLQLPLHNLDGIVCFGNVLCSPFLMGACAEKGITISHLTEYGRFLASIKGATTGNVLLRREQYRKADDLMISAKLAKNMILGKIANCKTVLSRALRDHTEKIDTTKIELVTQSLSQSIKSLMDNDFNLDQLRGVEGDAARDYFSVFNELIIAQKTDFKFKGRNRRPPRDRVNCLLSFIYTLLTHDIRSALESVGLDSYVGFFHRDRPGRPSLALDLMEEFRPFLADRLVLSLINLKQISGNDFIDSTTGGILMNEETRKTVLINYQKRKQEEIFHPFIQEKIKIGLLFHVQALLLARYIRGDLDGYPVFIWK
ncbi:MAG: type I-C CRISPR-associated endonuclease Cas1c [Candidatus Margulisiibacteriota bacterium]|jgi:CRISPR-associated protein Cas1